MRALLKILTATLCMWLFGCVRFPQMDLRQPIYLVLDDSLFVYCKDSPIEAGICRAYISSQIQQGAWQWSRFFAGNLPLFIVVDSSGRPAQTINPPVEIRVQPKVCGETVQDPVDACYIAPGYFANPAIVLTDLANLHPALIAHELGHVLAGNVSHYNSDLPSIMQDGSLVEEVQARDVDWMCNFHAKCPVRQELDRVFGADEVGELDY